MSSQLIEAKATIQPFGIQTVSYCTLTTVDQQKQWISQLFGNFYTCEAFVSIPLVHSSKPIFGLFPHLILLDTPSQLNKVNLWNNKGYCRPFIVYLYKISVDETEDTLLEWKQCCEAVDLLIQTTEDEKETDELNVVSIHQLKTCTSFTDHMSLYRQSKLTLYLRAISNHPEAGFARKKEIESQMIALDSDKYPTKYVMNRATEQIQTALQMDMLLAWCRFLMDQITPMEMESIEATIVNVMATKEMSIKKLQKWIDFLFVLPYPLYLKMITVIPSPRMVMKTPVEIISLRHRTDLYQSMCMQLDYLPITFNYRRFAGSIDGYKETKELEQGLYEKYPKAFQKRTTGKRMEPGELGCWLSHIRIWEQGQTVLVLENRAVLSVTFGRDWPRIEKMMNACQDLIDIIWVGYHVQNDRRAEWMLDTSSKQSVPVAIDLYPTRIPVPRKSGGDVKHSYEIMQVPLPFAIGGTFAYSITKNGCAKLLDALTNASTPVNHPIDVWMQHHTDKKTICQYACYRPLVWHSYTSVGGDIRKHQRDNF